MGVPNSVRILRK